MNSIYDFSAGVESAFHKYSLIQKEKRLMVTHTYRKMHLLLRRSTPAAEVSDNSNKVVNNILGVSRRSCDII